MFPLVKRYQYFWIIPLFSLILAACNMPAQTPPPTDQPSEPGLVYTAAAQTVAARLTEAAIGNGATTVPIEQQSTPTPGQAQPTQTPAPSATPNPATATSAAPTPTRNTTPCDRAAFVKDVTYPDGSEVAPGATFVKTWTLENTGSCTWNSSYEVVFVGGDSMGAPASMQLTTGTVAPGQEINVSVTLKAPETPDEYEGNWKLRNGSGATFGIGSTGQSAFWVRVEVVKPVTPTPTATILYNFLDKAPNAEWRNATDDLPWGDPPTDKKGVAAYLEDVKLEDGKTYDLVLATYPEITDDGIISGLFSSYVVSTNDRFTARLAFRSSCDDGKVKFMLKYREGSNVVGFKEWIETCNGKLTSVDVDLSSLNGKTVQFILEVSAYGEMENDRAIWVDPRILH